MFLNGWNVDPKYMENEKLNNGLEYLDDLCLRYREIEKSKAVHLDMCELIVSTDGRRRREWVSFSELALEQKHDQ